MIESLQNLIIPKLVNQIARYVTLVTLRPQLVYFSVWETIVMPLISVSMYPGRSKEQKAEFAAAITEAAIKILKTKKEHVIIVYKENPKENWFMSGEPL